MVSAVFVASSVAEPDIVLIVGQEESWGLALVIDNPSIGAVQQTVLKQNYGFSGFNCRILGLNSE